MDPIHIDDYDTDNYWNQEGAFEKAVDDVQYYEECRRAMMDLGDDPIYGA